jgi:hypothetical protein
MSGAKERLRRRGGKGNRRAQGGLKPRAWSRERSICVAAKPGEGKVSKGKLGRQPPCCPPNTSRASGSLFRVQGHVSFTRLTRPWVYPSVASATREVLGEHGHESARSPQPRERQNRPKSGMQWKARIVTKPLRDKPHTESQPIPCVGKGVGIPISRSIFFKEGSNFV